tara:strand:- start:75 stop:677 length:603 start_codon:yes stop_codon:yes gene_type:complete
MENIQNWFKKTFKLSGVTDERLKTGYFTVTPGVLYAGETAIPMSNLASITKLEESRARLLLIISAIPFSLLTFTMLLSTIKNPLNLFWVLLFGGILALIIKALLRPSYHSLVFQASSGKTLTVLSQDTKFILNLRSKVFEVLEGQIKQPIKVHLDASKITNVTYKQEIVNRNTYIAGDASLENSTFNKTTEKRRGKKKRG